MRAKRTRSAAATLTLVVAWGATWSLGAQELQQSVFVSVTRSGEPVLDLTADEFVVEEDGRRREVLRVERAEVPMQVAILVDDSQGLARNISHVRNGLAALIDALPDGQQVALVTFGDHLTTMVDYTSKKDRLREAASQYAPFSQTGVFLGNAIAETAADLDRRGAIRPIIVLLTSERASAQLSRVTLGRDRSGTVVSPRGSQGLSYRVVLDVLRETKVAVHTLVVRGTITPTFADTTDLSTATRGLLQEDSGDRDRASLLQQLPKVTGGGREELGNTSAIPKMLARIGNEVSNQYLLTYSRPIGLIPPEKLEIKVTRRRHRVRSTPSRPIMVR
jgi:VWFA-related protein